MNCKLYFLYYKLYIIVHSYTILCQTETQYSIIPLRDYKRFQIDLFRSELDYELSKLDVCNLEFEHFKNIFNEVKHTLMKEKY